MALNNRSAGICVPKATYNAFITISHKINIVPHDLSLKTHTQSKPESSKELKTLIWKLKERTEMSCETRRNFLLTRIIRTIIRHAQTITKLKYSQSLKSGKKALSRGRHEMFYLSVHQTDMLKNKLGKSNETPNVNH